MSARAAMKGLSVRAGEFSALMASYGAAPMAVGVSGGMDSLALLYLLARNSKTRVKNRIFALSVDHGLRPQAAEEVRHAGRVARFLGVPHVILRNRRALVSNQAAARAVRFGLLASWCRRNGVRYCALAHHEADQAETFLFRLARGSGIEGLAAMAERRQDRSCYFIRPLLSVPRRRLEAVLREAGIGWREDPSNDDPSYSRTHLSHALALLKRRGFSPDRLARAALGARRMRLIVSQAARDFLSKDAEFSSGGFYWIARDAFYALPRPVADHVLGHILKHIGGRDFAPSQIKLDRFYEGLHGGLGAGATLAGCRVIMRKARFLIFREFADIGESLHLSSGEEGIWDRRFHVRVGAGGGSSARFKIAPMGRDSMLPPGEGASRGLISDVRGMPRIVRPCLPALWRDEVLLSVPHLGFAPERLAASPLEGVFA